MSSTDVRALLKKPVNEIKAPPVWPAGTYYGFVAKYEEITSTQKKTPGLRFWIQPTQADSTIPEDQLGEVDFAKGRQFKADFWITEASLSMLKDFLVKIGVSETRDDGAVRGLDEMIPEAQNKQVMMVINQTPSSDGERFFNNLDEQKITKAPE